jgi:signal transduction histidine kinase
VHGVEAQLRQVVVNLLDNAERHARTRVRVEVRRAGDRAVLEVSDDGPGIPVGDRQRVFERFVRLDSARDRHSGGSGLGLAIVRDVVAAHHGRVSIEDAEPGVRIVVDLPGCVMADGGEQP